MSEKTISKSISKHNFKTKIINDCELFPSCWGEVVSVDALKQNLEGRLSFVRRYINMDDVWARKQAETEVRTLEWLLGLLDSSESPKGEVAEK